MSAQPCRLTGRPAPSLDFFGSILEASYGHSTQMNPVASEDTVTSDALRILRTVSQEMRTNNKIHFIVPGVMTVVIGKPWSKRLPRVLSFHL